MLVLKTNIFIGLIGIFIKQFLSNTKCTGSPLWSIHLLRAVYQLVRRLEEGD